MFLMSLAIADLTVGTIVMPISSAYAITGRRSWRLTVSQSPLGHLSPMALDWQIIHVTFLPRCDTRLGKGGPGRRYVRLAGAGGRAAPLQCCQLFQLLLILR